MKRTTLEQLIGKYPGDDAPEDELDAWQEREDELYGQGFAGADYKMPLEDILDTIDGQLKEHGLEIELVDDMQDLTWRIVKTSGTE